MYPLHSNAVGETSTINKFCNREPRMKREFVNGISMTTAMRVYVSSRNVLKF